ncbi:unnamed protein product [Zymoseptoria tritici ST99CH_3D7]|uniref:Uncharacterized protein n=1 Tax=Zymoseptoria tritici (strain ST99CH_3D7) TaxID=1276538 RepID=A0A1X7RW47_ZYMT9|nr:unnamed protein product [Zymoseptoria tritici ST99CH_3D7]
MEQVQQHLEYARNYVLDKLPADRQSRIFLGGASASVAGVVLLPLLYHYSLGRKISHTHPNRSVRQAALECGEISSLPKEIVENAQAYRIAHDKVVKHIPNLVFMKNEELTTNFTKMLRRNMASLSRMPQGWMLWLVLSLPEQRRTFSREYIESLDFEEGDVVCGIYRVAVRTAVHVELELQAPTSDWPISGLTIISLRPRNDGASLISETIQWTKKDSGAILPLERWVGGFLHSFAARWLVVTGGAGAGRRKKRMR